ncbi:MAG: hypothetical protein IPL19_28965 [Sandaracinaceae bacterium]|nr:hypothetical protein [Sandaracinaceae bacterium]MBP7682514.1 hypothetical protein [Deltaproteobacteria bacterium]MBK7156051.1 hypothetical protein [Sandaracinaceae bacterium]MBK7777491.1 hypothetical protein [Sandaracinaceae bacterium]MBK8411994.1 hypothetical protein [Sandaracinaceae bacterium]
MTSSRVRSPSVFAPLTLIVLAIAGGGSACSSPSGVALEDTPRELAGALCDQLVNCATCETRDPNGTVCDSSNECLSGRCADDGSMTNTRRCTDRVTCG